MHFRVKYHEKPCFSEIEIQTNLEHGKAGSKKGKKYFSTEDVKR